MAILTLLCLKNNYSQELDYRAQSLFIYKFTKYIVWPENKLKGDFVIGVYGNSPLYDELVLMASLKKAGNDQNIVVKEVRDEDDLSGFHLIYVPASKSRQINGISEKVGDLPVVIVAEREGLARKGATINFIILENNVLKFEVNVDKLTRQKLSISDELLKLGFKV
ncbi:MAG: YfiR family protein [Bacteroidales bacterium]|nr:YfiR family protein [Bacteroidales bacterium]